MSRSTQIIGLTVLAEAFLHSNCEMVSTLCPICKKKGHFVRNSERYSQFPGMFGEMYPLHKYKLKDQSFLYEYVQADPWSSGPCIFLALSTKPDGKGKQKFKWSDKEIEEYA